MTKVPTVWDSRYCCDAAPLSSTTKQAGVVQLAQAEGLLDLRPAAPRTSDGIFRDIVWSHATPYVVAVQTGEPRHLAESQGFNWSPAFAESVAQIWHGHQHALALSRQHPLVLHPVSGAHHARRMRGSGFCTFNYLVGVAEKFLLTEGRCLIIDLDAHYGDGTAEMIVGDDRFAMFDIHGGGHTGGTWGDQVWSFEVQFGRQYLQFLKSQLPAFLDKFKPTLVQYLAGADPHARDAIGGIEGMGVAMLKQRDEFVFGEVLRRGIPTVVTLAGGYIKGVSEEIHLNTIRAMADALDLTR